MDLSSPLFLFLFLPVFLLIYLVSAGKARTGILLLASVIFLAWGDASAILWLGGILVSGYWMGLAIAKAQETGQNAAKWLWAGLGVNVILLAFFKYLTAFGQEGLLWLNTPETWVDDLSGLTVPIGLSYVTFQLITYLVDVWKGNTPAEKKFVSFSAYLLFFPKLVSGPITRYKPFAVQMEQLNPSMDDVAAGFRRLLSGFIKRTVIANQLALMANAVFNQPTANVEPKFAWLGLAAYTLQIFFDFSGYTDMALGLGLMIGVRLPENFNFPYIAQSVSDFWRRWHITLSTWFREYVFYPLERKRFKWMGQQVNILIVFLLTGLWHGFNPTFMVWGMIHGIALAVESLGFGRWLKGAWRPLQHLYTLTIVVIGWVFFRSQDLNFAFEFFRRLAGDRSNLMPLPFSQTSPIPFIEPSFIMALIAGTLFSFPLTSLWRQLRERFESRQSNSYLFFQIVEDAALLLFFVLGLGLQLSGSFLPNLYAKF